MCKPCEQCKEYRKANKIEWTRQRELANEDCKRVTAVDKWNCWCWPRCEYREYDEDR